MVMRFFKIYQSYIQLLPVLVLTLGCGLDIGALITASIILYFIFCRVYHESYISMMVQSRVFIGSCIVISIWMMSMLIPSIWNGGDIGIIGKYACRIAPFFLFVMMGKPYKGTFFTIWLGIGFSVLWYCADTLLHPNFIDGTSVLHGRLMGSFGWPNSLANVLSLLLPIVLFGVMKYWKRMPVLGLTGLLLYFWGLIVIVLTGSRNAYISCFLTVILLMAMMYACRDWLTFKIIGAGILIATIFVVSFAPPVFYQRIHQNLGSDGRIYLLEVSKQIYEEHPVAGIGIGNWGTVYKERFELPGKEKNIKSPHNIYIQTTNESGLIGLVGLLALFGFQAGTLWKSGFLDRSNSLRTLRWTGSVCIVLAVIFVSGLFDYDFFSRHPMHLYWFYWGLAVFDICWHSKE
jgi:O-antigen ligase